MDVDSQALVKVEVGAGRSLLDGVVVDDEALWVAWEGARRAWLESKGRRSGRGNTVATYTVAFKQFFEWAGVPPWQVGTALAQNWTLHLMERGLADSSVNLKLSALSSFYSFVQKRYSAQTTDGREICLWPADRRNPFEVVERVAVSPYERAQFPTVEEAQELLAAINTNCLTGKRDFALLYTILVTCQRFSAIQELRWGDLREMEDGDFAFAYEYKGGKIKKAVLNRRCYQAICAYLRADGRPPEEMEAEDYVFVAINPERIRRLPGREEEEIDYNRPISNGLANRILKKYAKRIGMDLERAHIHGLRHAGARLRVQQMKKGGRSADYMELMELLGHSSLAVTQIYSSSVLEDPEDPGGDAAAEALLPRGPRRRKKEEPGAEQGRLFE